MTYGLFTQPDTVYWLMAYSHTQIQCIDLWPIHIIEYSVLGYGLFTNSHNQVQCAGLWPIHMIRTGKVCWTMTFLPNQAQYTGLRPTYIIWYSVLAYTVTAYSYKLVQCIG